MSRPSSTSPEQCSRAQATAAGAQASPPMARPSTEQAGPMQMRVPHAPPPQNKRPRPDAAVIRSILLILATICILALCFALPTVATRIHDVIIGSETDTIAMESIILNTESEDSINDLLQFSMLGYETVNYDITVSPAETEAVLRTATEILAFFEARSAPLLGSDVIVGRNAVPFLVKSVNMDSARLLWECGIEDELGNYVVIYIDDASGWMLSCNVYSNLGASGTQALPDDGSGLRAPDEAVSGDEMAAEAEDRADDVDGPADGADGPGEDANVDAGSGSIQRPETDAVHDGRWLWSDPWGSAEVLARYYGFGSVVDVHSQIDGQWDTGTEISGTMVFMDDNGEMVWCGFKQHFGKSEYGGSDSFAFNVMTDTLPVAQGSSPVAYVP